MNCKGNNTLVFISCQQTSDVPMENTERQVKVFSISPTSSTTAPAGIQDRDSTVVPICPLSKSVQLHLSECKMGCVFLELDGY